MKKLILLISCLLPLSTFMFAQTAFKLNVHLQYQSYPTTKSYDGINYTYTDENYQVNILPAPTIIMYRQNGNFHEIGISRLQFNIDDNSILRTDLDEHSVYTDGAKETTFNLGVRYDYNFCLTNKDKSLIGYLGVSISPIYHSRINDPYVNASFVGKYTSTSVLVGVVPRFIWKLNQSIFIDFNIPINLYDLKYEHYRIFNPSLTIKQQSYGYFDSNFLPKFYEVRLGVGILL